VATQGGGVSKSATKAPRAGIGREGKRGISTFLLARSGSIRAFVADLDNPRRCGPPGTPGKGATGRSVAGTGLWEGRPRPGDDHNGHPGERTGPTGHGDGLPGRPPGSETCTSHSKVQFQLSFSSAKCTSRRRSGPTAAAADRDDDPAVHDDPDLQAATSGEKGSMRAQLDKIHLSSHHVSSARQNPPQLDSCELSSHDVS